MLRIWGRRNSINVQKVLWCCGELNVQFERIDAGMEFGINNTPEYLAKNPNARVPTIEEGDWVLWESHAIVRYLCGVHGLGTLWPGSPRAFADVDKWMDWYHTSFEPDLRVVFWQLIRTAPEKRDMAAVEAARLRCIKALALLDAQLTGKKFLGGTTFTMGDIPLGVAAYRWFALNVERPALRNVEAWYLRLTERPAYQQHVMLPLT
ncbi:MAG: glutathione S-transferase [Betaproteobacteria bacterium]|nr:glutathione S-transferase [Betaproteobacteria bacterium]